MRIVFCGTPESAVPSLRALAACEDWVIERVLTQPDRRRGRGRGRAPSPVRAAAEELGLAVRTPEKLKELREELTELAPDVVAVVAYGHIFRRWLLELPRYGCVNVHFSLLPRHRGVAPVARAILEGDDETGVATMQMDRGVDTGGILLEQRVPIAASDTAGSLTARLAELAGPLLTKTLAEIDESGLSARPQPEEGATYAPRLLKEDGRLDWTRPAVEIERRLRGLDPWPGAFTTFRGATLKIHRARVVPGALPPGTMQVVDDALCVGTGDGLLALEELQSEGRARLAADAWRRGTRAQDGVVLGAPS